MGPFLRRLQEKSSLNFAESELDISQKNLEIPMLQATKADRLTKFAQKIKEVLCKISESEGGGSCPKLVRLKSLTN